MRIIHLALFFALPLAIFAYQSDPPMIIRRVQPTYPVEALKNRLEGKVILELEISRKGRVMNARVLRTDNLIFNQPALDAVKLWRYRITKRNLRDYCVMSQDCSVMYKSVTVVFTLPHPHHSSPHP